MNVTATRTFSLLLLALFDVEYILFWVDIGSGGASSHAQILSQSKLRKKIRDGVLRLQTTEFLGKGGLCLDAMDGEILWQKKTHRRKENSNHHYLQEQRQKMVRAIVLTCVLLHMLRTHKGGAYRVSSQ